MRMSAGPHLLLRLRRWWQLKLLQTRIDQMSGLAAQIEADIERDITELAALRRRLRQDTARLTAAQHLATRTHSPMPRGI
jgi:hypothetical protein